MPFSPISEAIVLFTVPAVFWHVLIVLGVGGARRSALARAALVLLLLTAGAWLLVYGVDGGPVAADLPWLPLLTVAAAVMFGLTFGDRLLGNGVPQQLLLVVQLFRPIGLIFLLEDARGVLPASFAQPAGWGDLLTGLTAAVVLLRYPSGPIPARAVILVAVVGLADFTSAFFFGFTSSATPMQLFAFDNPNRVLEWPLGFIPILLVPYAILAHILSLKQLARDRAHQ